MTETKEIWKDIEGYEGFYQVSNLGRIRRTFYLKPKIKKDGYLAVCLSQKNKKREFTVHRLVAKAFIPNPENKPCVNHISAIKTDNRMANLEWCTQKENVQHSIKKGNRDFCGEKSPLAKLTNDQAKMIRKEYVHGKSKYNQNALAKKYGVDRGTISSIILNKTYKNI